MGLKGTVVSLPHCEQTVLVSTRCIFPEAGTCAHALSAVPFTRLAPLRFVLKTLIGKKHLLAGCEYEFRRAIRALQNLIAVFHMPLQAGKE